MNHIQLVATASRKPLQLNRSCEECRARKVRCIQQDPTQSSRCARCTERELPCTFAHAARRNRKRVDGRIKELERKLEVLLSTSRLAEGQGANKPIANQSPGIPRSAPTAVHRESTSSGIMQNGDDVIDSGLLSLPKAIELYHRFHTELSPQFPAIFISPSISPEYIRQEKPSLFLSIITAAAASFEPNIASVLISVLEKNHAHNVMVDGKRSVSLAQALLVSTIWHHPSERFDGLKFSRYAQMAADIVADLNLPQKLDNYFSSKGRSTNNYFDSEEQVVEDCRTLIACFVVCSRYVACPPRSSPRHINANSIALSFRRSSTITYTALIGKCMVYLKTSPHAAPQDDRLAIWAELQYQADIIRSASLIENLNQCDNGRAQNRIRASLINLTTWMKDVDKQYLDSNDPYDRHSIQGLLTGSPDLTLINYYYTRLYAHEQMLYTEHQPEDFKPPYIIRAAIVYGEDPMPLDYNTLLALNDCLTAGHSLLEVFLGMTVHSLRSLPVVMYARMFYAMIIFTKLYTSAKSPESQYQGLIDLQSLAFESYLWRLISALQAARGEENFRVPSIFLGMLERLSQWTVARLQLQLQEYQYSNVELEMQPMNYGAPSTPTLPSISRSTFDTPSHLAAWAFDMDSILPFL
jgi:hypothetical protein